MRFLTAIILLLCASSAGLAAGFDPNNPAASGYSLVCSVHDLGLTIETTRDHNCIFKYMRREYHL